MVRRTIKESDTNDTHSSASTPRRATVQPQQPAMPPPAPARDAAAPAAPAAQGAAAPTYTNDGVRADGGDLWVVDSGAPHHMCHSYGSHARVIDPPRQRQTFTSASGHEMP